MLNWCLNFELHVLWLCGGCLPTPLLLEAGDDALLTRGAPGGLLWRVRAPCLQKCQWRCLPPAVAADLHFRDAAANVCTTSHSLQATVARKALTGKTVQF